MNAYEDDPDVMKKAYEGVRGLVVHVTSEMWVRNTNIAIDG